MENLDKVKSMLQSNNQEIFTLGWDILWNLNLDDSTLKNIIGGCDKDFMYDIHVDKYNEFFHENEKALELKNLIGDKYEVLTTLEFYNYIYSDLDIAHLMRCYYTLFDSPISNLAKFIYNPTDENEVTDLYIPLNIPTKGEEFVKIANILEIVQSVYPNAVIRLNQGRLGDEWDYDALVYYIDVNNTYDIDLFYLDY
jgi:hypothetical protein